MSALRKWAWRIFGGIAGVVLLGTVIAFVLSQLRISRSYAVPDEPVAIPSDAAAIARGEHLATIGRCIDCHSPSLAGRMLYESAMIGRFLAPNLTRGNGGAAARFTDRDWIRAIRHGVRPDGTPLFVMPADESYPLSDADLGFLIAYLKSVPAVDNELPASTISPIGRLAITLMPEIRILSAEWIDHLAPRPAAPERGVTPEYGKYLAVKCIGCHGPNLSGGKIPGTPPDWPPALNLTPYPGAALAQWSEAEFDQAMRLGITPRGNTMNNKYMPWKVIGQMSDDERRALWLYLKSLPPAPYGSRSSGR